MKQILFIAPSELNAQRAQEIIDERNMEVDVRMSILEEALIIARQGIERGIKVIISRGGTNSYIKEHVDVPVIDVKIASGSYIDAFEKARDIHGNIAFFTFDEVADSVKTLCYLLDVKANFYRFQDDQSARQAVETAMKDGAVLGIGGSLTKIYAEQLGLEYIMVENSREDIELALDSAQQMLKSLLLEERRKRDLQFRLQRYEAIFNYTHDGIIAIDKKGIVEVVNKQADAILPLKNKPYEGKHVDEILPNTKLLTILRSGEMETDELMKVQNVIINTNRIPVIIDGKVEGVVATFRDIESIRLSEQKIRSNLHKKGLASKYRFSDIIGDSKAMKRAIRIAKGYAKTKSNILLLGEIGTGKEMFAHCIHHESDRKKNPFVAVNCADISFRALQTELLGYEEGFSPFGVKGSKEGAFELAHGGTIFLDKIGDAPLEMQAQILRIIESYEVRRLGGDHTIPIDVRVIASTNKNLTQEIHEGKFMEELFYRLSVLTLELPPLRDRDNDYRLFCEDWFHRYFGADFRRYEALIHAIMDHLQDYSWQGNVRELSNLVERTSVLLKNQMTLDEILTTLPGEIALADDNGDIQLDKWTRASLLEALTTNKLNISRTARLLNCSRSTLYKKMKELNITITNTDKPVR